MVACSCSFMHSFVSTLLELWVSPARNGLIVITVFDVRLKKDIIKSFVCLCYYDSDICNYSYEYDPKYVLKTFINSAVFYGQHMETWMLSKPLMVFLLLPSMLSVYFSDRVLEGMPQEREVTDSGAEIPIIQHQQSA